MFIIQCKEENFLKGSLDSIPSPSEEIQIMGIKFWVDFVRGETCLRPQLPARK